MKIAKRCLMPAQAARPRNASEVANAVREYLSGVEDRAHKAEVEAAKARVREEGERRAKRLTLGLAAAILLGVLGGGAGFWRADRTERERASRAAQTVGTALEEVSLALGRAREAGSTRMEVWPEALTAAEQAVSLAEKVEAPDDVLARAVSIRDTAVQEHAEAKREAEQVANEQEMLARLRDVRDYSWVPRAVTLTPTERAEEAAGFEEAFRVGGIDWAIPRKAAARVRASKHRDELVLALDTWRQLLAACEVDTRAVDRHLQLADPDPLRAQIRTAEMAKDADTLHSLIAESGLRGLPTRTLSLLSSAFLIAGDSAAALESARAWRAVAPDDSDADFAVGRALLWQQSVTAVHYREAALSLERAVAKHPRGLAARSLLATALLGMQRLDDAIAAIQEALDLAPEERGLLVRLGNMLSQRAQVQSKAEQHEAAYETQKQAVAAWERADPDGRPVASSNMYHFLAVYAQALRRWPEVLEAAQRAVDLNPQAAPGTLETLAMAQSGPRECRGRHAHNGWRGRLGARVSPCAHDSDFGLDLPRAPRGSAPEGRAHRGPRSRTRRFARCQFGLLQTQCRPHPRRARPVRGRGGRASGVRGSGSSERRNPGLVGSCPPSCRRAGPCQARDRACDRDPALPPENLGCEHGRRVPSSARLGRNRRAGRQPRGGEKALPPAFPSDPSGLYGVYVAGVGGSLLVCQARGDEAREAVREALNLFPRYIPALQTRATLESLAGNTAGAIRDMRKAASTAGPSSRWRGILLVST